MPTSNTSTDTPKMIDANQLLLAKFPKATTEYQHGWNDALQAAYDVETEQIDDE